MAYSVISRYHCVISSLTVKFDMSLVGFIQLAAYLLLFFTKIADMVTADQRGIVQYYSRGFVILLRTTVADHRRGPYYYYV